MGPSSRVFTVCYCGIISGQEWQTVPSLLKDTYIFYPLLQSRPAGTEHREMTAVAATSRESTHKVSERCSLQLEDSLIRAKNSFNISDQRRHSIEGIEVYEGVLHVAPHQTTETETEGSLPVRHMMGRRSQSF